MEQEKEEEEIHLLVNININIDIIRFNMFTGLIELLCPITEINPLDSSTAGGGGHSITIGGADDILTDCNIGDSIAVNGQYQ